MSSQDSQDFTHPFTDLELKQIRLALSQVSWSKEGEQGKSDADRAIRIERKLNRMEEHPCTVFE